jgi:hypothetical protein
VSARSRLAGAEHDLWTCSRETLGGIADYLAARLSGDKGRAQAQSAVGRIDTALDRMRAIAPEFKGTWGCYDIERFHRIWIEGLRRRIDHPAQKEIRDEPPA